MKLAFSGRRFPSAKQTEPRGDAMAQTQTKLEGSFRMPAFEHATVSDAMRPGVISCPPQTSLKTVARMMASNHVHSVVVTRPGVDSGGRPWGIVSDLDLVRVGGEVEDRTAGQACANEVVSVGPEDTLERAAQLMAEHGTSHLIVIDPRWDDPIGVLSTLDMAGIIAWGRA
jgi:CBS domain-containing protein